MQDTTGNHGGHSFPPGIVLLLLFLAVFFFMLIGQGVTLGYAYLQGLSMEGLLEQMGAARTAADRNTVRIMTLITHLFTFIVPALAIAVLLARNAWAQHLRLTGKPATVLLFVGMVWIVLAFPLAQYTYWLNQQLPLPDWMINLEDSTNGLIRSFLIMEGPWEFFLSLLVMAILPALGEEMIFRGLVQKHLERGLKNPIWAVWVAALIFSAFHFQFQGFIPRLLLGAILGYLYFWSRNLWVPIAAHFVNNGLQVVAAFYMGEALLDMEQSDEQQVTIWGALGSLVLVLSVGWFLHKNRIQERQDPSN